MTRKNKITWHIIIFIMPILLLYILTAYVLDEIDPMKWHEGARMLHVMLYLAMQTGHMLLSNIETVEKNSVEWKNKVR